MSTAIRIAVDMVREGLISKEEAILRIDPSQLNQLLRPVFSIEQKRKAISDDRLLAKGLNAGPGVASAQVVFSAQDALQWSKKGKEVILVRMETSPEDIRGLSASIGILTARGGMTSHAALVGRQMGKVCVVGCSKIDVDYKKKTFHVHDKKITVKEGDFISLDGTTGEVILGTLETFPSKIMQAISGDKLAAKSKVYQTYQDLMKWADEFRHLKVLANADQPEQATTALNFGAQGIGLCRTEHMFFGENRIEHVQKMILADNEKDRAQALAQLLKYQKEDFYRLFQVMDGHPVVIRTLDPPLHEFLPKTSTEIKKLSASTGLSANNIKNKIDHLIETNPMLGLRGCRRRRRERFQRWFE